MYPVTRLHTRARFVSTIGVPLALLAATAASSADAQLSEIVNIDNSYGTRFDPRVPLASQIGGPVETIYQRNTLRTGRSELGVNYTATADSSGFFFLHDNYCVGTCDTVSSTNIVFDVTNTGDGFEDVRFDSQITPGHLAKIYGGSATAGFTFQVVRIFGEGEEPLYSASGSVGPEGIVLNTGGLTFNGLNDQQGRNFQLKDWGATNLSVYVGQLSGFETATIAYRASYWSSNDASCTNLLRCSGAQAVFGDPRNNGGVSALSRSFFSLDADPEPEPGQAVIGGDYDPFLVPFAFVRLDAPPSFDEPDAPQLTYDVLYRSRGGPVPEPASWAMMILGFGVVGSAARRRRTGLRTA